MSETSGPPSCTGPIRHRRPRPQTSCQQCHRRKIKCDKELPCNQCVKTDAASRCSYASADHSSATRDGTSPQRASHAHYTERSVEGFRGDVQATTRYVDATPRPGMSQENREDAFNHFGYQSWPPGFRGLEKPETPKPHIDLTVPQGRKDTVEHRWPADGPSRGRTHYSWSLKKTEALLRPFDQHDIKRSGGHHAIVLDAQLESLISELPTVDVCRSLSRRYFETFGTVYHIIEQEPYFDALAIALEKPERAPVDFWVRALIVFAIGNATLPLVSTPVSRTTSLRWLELASPTTTVALETSSEFDIEAIRTWTLINLARQVISSNDLADYVSAGGAVKAAMACGLHQSAADPFSIPTDATSQIAYDRKMLYFAAVDLDLSASITAGMVPTTDRLDHGQLRAVDVESSPTSDVDIAMRETLYLSLAARYQVLKHLNEEHVLSSWKVARLSEDLVAAMAPISVWQTRFRDQNSFALDYLSAMQQRYLFALYRPFASEVDIGGSSGVASARIATDLARKRMAEICAFWKQGSKQSPMAALFMGHGVTARADVLNALCYLWWDIVRQGPISTRADEVLLSISRDSSIRLLEDFMEVSHSMLRSHAVNNSWRLVAITEMALAHIAAASNVGQHTSEYKSLMDRAAERVEDILHRHDQRASIREA